MVLDRDAEFGNLMQHRELIQPRNHCAHWEDAWLVSIAWRAIVAHRAAAQCGAHFLALSLLDDHVYADNWLLKFLASSMFWSLIDWLLLIFESEICSS